MIYYAALKNSITKQKTFHYHGNLSNQKLLDIPDLLIITQTPEGVFLDRYTLDGSEVGDTWHLSVTDAKQQAEFEYGDALDAWIEVNTDISDPLSYVLDQLKKN